MHYVGRFNVILAIAMLMVGNVVIGAAPQGSHRAPSVDKVGSRDDSEVRLLHAAKIGNESEVAVLLQANAFVDVLDEHGFTALHLASRAGHIVIMEHLLTAGADIQAHNKNNNTPLHSAAYGDQDAAIKLLVQKGADLHACNKDGDTPLHSAAWKNCKQSVRVLAEMGARLESSNKDGDKPLHLAAWNNSIAAITMLAAKGASLNATNNDGQTPSVLAQQKNNREVLEALSCQERFLMIVPKIEELIKRIERKQNELKVILSDYQTYGVSEYEIERSVRTLRSLHENSLYLGIDGMIDSAAVMLPSNLPLYSLVVFSLIPSFLVNQVYVRPNSLLQNANIVSRIYDELELESLFPGIKIINTDHAGFQPYINDAPFVVFTGKPNNATKLLQNMKPGAILALNGSGHNPVVVTDSANVDAAVKGALHVKGFNGGQDCAGPDALLVHCAVAQEFIEKFSKQFASLPMGKLQDPATVLGPIGRLDELRKFGDVFYHNAKDILVGGTIDYKNGIVAPTTIVRGIERYPNYNEMFGPVAFVHPYKSDEDLAYYFQDPDGNYKANRMYVSLYGSSAYVEDKDDASNPGKDGNVGIVLHNQTIHDVEIGYKPYGGYSFGASCLIKKTGAGAQRVAMPILIPQAIAEYLIKGRELPVKAKIKREVEAKHGGAAIKKGKEIELIVKEFQQLVQDVFGENVSFGFIFGSAAKGKLRVQGPDRDDLDTFICLKREDNDAVAVYKQRLAALHDKYNLQVDAEFPAEIMTVAELESVVGSLDQIAINVDKRIEGKEFDHIFWTHALTDKKIGFIGDGRFMSSLIKPSMPYITSWSKQVVEQLKQKEVLPDNVMQKFSGLNKEAAIDKLSELSPHLVVHLGLHYSA